MILLLDSNIWVSVAIKRDFDLIEEIVKKQHTLVTCSELITELNVVLARPKFNKYFPVEFPNQFLYFHRVSAKYFQIGNIEYVVADEKDNYLFALCKVANADYLVTGDKLILSIAEYHNTRVITLTELRKIINI